MKRVTVPVPSAPVLIGLVFALLSALFTGSFISWAATPANVQAVPSTVITGCVGSSTPGGSSLTLAGRTITASTLVRIDPSGTCAANENAVTWNNQVTSPTFSQTVVITSSADQFDNGNRLLAAMTTISNSVPAIANAYLVKLEPGNYDLNGRALNMLTHVDLEGSGQDVTYLSSTIDSNSPPTTGVLNLAAGSEVRNLTVLNYGESNYGTTIYANYSNQGGLTSLYPSALINVTVVPIIGGTLESRGLYTGPTTSVLVQDSFIDVENGGSDFPTSNLILFGIDSQGTLKVTNSTVVARTQAGYKTYGIRANTASGVSTIIQQTTIDTERGWWTNRAVDIGSSTTITIQNSTLTTYGIKTSENTAVYNSSPYTVIQNSNLKATGGDQYDQNSINNALVNLATLKVATSQVNGGVSNTGTLKCVGSYNANFDVLGTDCTNA